MCMYVYIYIYTHIYTCYIVVIVRPPYEGRRGCGAEPRDRRHRAGGDRGGSKCHNPDLLLLLVLLLLLLLLVVVVVYEHIWTHIHKNHINKCRNPDFLGFRKKTFFPEVHGGWYFVCAFLIRWKAPGVPQKWRDNSLAQGDRGFQVYGSHLSVII